METYLLVHGAWLGGWCWRRVVPFLRGAGHEVFTPTLTGLGERVHLANPRIDLDTHTQDVLAVLQYEDLHDVILVGQSYGGVVITAVAEHASERLAQLVYLGAAIPRDNQAVADLPRTAAMIAEFQRRGSGSGEDWQLPPLSLEHLGVTAEEDVRWVGSRLVAQPIKTFQQRVRLTSPAAAALPRAYIHCTSPALVHFEPFVERAKAEGWRYRELPTPHSPNVTAPELLANVLLELA
jgi:pimeloyl-ACP methyl ester carboxylesterase